MTKVKKKIKSSITKRFKITSTGKVMFVHQNGRHHKLKKSGSRIRRQNEPAIAAAPFAKKIKKIFS